MEEMLENSFENGNGWMMDINGEQLEERKADSPADASSRSEEEIRRAVRLHSKIAKMIYTHSGERQCCKDQSSIELDAHDTACRNY